MWSVILNPYCMIFLKYSRRHLSQKSSPFLCVFCDLLGTCTGSGCIRVLLLFSHHHHTLCFVCFLSFLLVSLSLPFGQPPLRISLEILNHFLHILRISHSLLLLNTFFMRLFLEILFLLMNLLLLWNMDIFLYILKIVKICDFFWHFDSSKHFLCFLAFSFVQAHLCKLDFGGDAVWVNWEDSIEDIFLFL